LHCLQNPSPEISFLKKKRKIILSKRSALHIWRSLKRSKKCRKHSLCYLERCLVFCHPTLPSTHPSLYHNSQALGPKQAGNSKMEGLFTDKEARQCLPEKGQCPTPTACPLKCLFISIFMGNFGLCPGSLLTYLILRGCLAPGKWVFMHKGKCGFC
jgi:hypothetical protein